MWKSAGCAVDQKQTGGQNHSGAGREIEEVVTPDRTHPPFSDANWISMNTSIAAGGNESVRAAVVDSSGNVYVGGDFRSVIGNRIAKCLHQCK